MRFQKFPDSWPKTHKQMILEVTVKANPQYYAEEYTC